MQTLTRSALRAAADPSQAHHAGEGAEAARQWIALARTEMGASASPAAQQALGEGLSWLATHAFRQGHYEAAQAAAVEGLMYLDGAAQFELRCETLRIQAMANVERAAFAEALEAAQLLTAEASAVGSAAWSLMGAYAVATVYARLGDTWQAVRLLEGAMAEHAPASPPRERMIAHVGMGAFLGDGWHRMRDVVSPDESRVTLERALVNAQAAAELLRQHEHPAFITPICGNLGEVLLHLGQLETARPWLERALRTAQSAGQHAYRQRIQCSWGHWLLADGQAEASLQLVHQVLREAGPLGAEYAPPAQATLIRLHDVAYRAAHCLGRSAEAFEHLLAYERAERRRTLYELQALGDLFVTRGEAVGLLVKAQQMEHRATHDVLTGLANRSHLTLQAATLRPDDALALIDIDHFKHINDRFGHAAGDAVLVTLGRLLMDFGRGHDLAVRLGGEEFVLLLRGGGPSPAQAEAVAERFRQRVASHVDWPALPAGQGVTVSVGVARVGEATLEQALQQADAALYRAKAAGRNRVEVAASAPLSAMA